MLTLAPVPNSRISLRISEYHEFHRGIELTRPRNHRLENLEAGLEFVFTESIPDISRRHGSIP
jgi:hypothetical protein